MPQLTRGARKHLDVISEALEAIQRARTIGHKHTIYNPHFAMDKFEEVGALVERIREAVRELEPLLERQAPEYERRLAEVEQRLAEIEQGKVVSFRQKAVGDG